MGALFSPFNYLKLTQHGKWIVDWIVPFGFALCFVVLATFHLPKFDFHSENGLIAMMRSFVETLPGFYIAALTAVATFGRPEIMDTPLNPGDIYLKKKIANSEDQVLVTRRKFLCLMFAYLCALSVVLTVLPAVAIAMRADVSELLKPLALLWAERAYTLIYLGLLAQMLVITLWGLYYLSDRIHQSEFQQ